MKKYSFVFYITGILAALAFAASLVPATEQSPSGIKIVILSTPAEPPSPNLASEMVRGAVSGGNPKEQKVVVYARGGSTWWVQPTVAEPYTDLENDGSWESETHGGTLFVAFLVRNTYKPEATLTKLPSVGAEILAKSEPAPAGRKQDKKLDK